MCRALIHIITTTHTLTDSEALYEHTWPSDVGIVRSHCCRSAAENTHLQLEYYEREFVNDHALGSPHDKRATIIDQCALKANQDSIINSKKIYTLHLLSLFCVKIFLDKTCSPFSLIFSSIAMLSERLTQTKDASSRSYH